MKLQLQIKESKIALGLKANDAPKLNDFGEIQEVIVNVEMYKGQYEVTPKLEEQVLNTKNKTLNKDMTIKSIPIHETRNDSGGYTLHIAKEL